MDREYGWSVKGQRTHGAKPASWGKNLTIIGALGVSGLQAVMTVTGPTTGEVFRTYIEKMVVPTLEPGQVVIMDNLSSHKVAGVKAAIEAAEAFLVYLPPYSPDMNPIEMCWSKLKNFLRARGARTIDELNIAIGAAMKTVTAEDCENWFRHAGYAPSN